MMYFFILFYPFILFSQVLLDPIEVADSAVSDDLIGLDNENSPLSSHAYSAKTLESQRIKTSNDLSYLDASLTNNYSGSGYWDSLNIRGFGVDNRTNYFRDGLRINARTAIPLENKESVEVIKGLGAFQNSSSSPSGSINYRVKRPKAIRDLRVELTERGGHLSHIDFGSNINDFAYRINLLNEEIRSSFNNNDGRRHLASSSFSYQLSNKSLIEAEIEWSRRVQQSLSAQGFWGRSLPPVDPQLNLNNQDWSRPVEFDSLFYSLRYSRELNTNWFLSVSAGKQHSITDDRMSYAFGCGSENNWTSFCRDGSFDVYDYRSESERRETYSSKLSLTGKFEGREVSQELSLNLRYTHQKEKSDFQAYNFVGVGEQEGRALPSDSTKEDPTTNLKEESLEVFIVDEFKMNKWSFWIGGNLQFRNLSTWKNDQSEKNKSENNFFTPWVALSHQLQSSTIYLSYTQAKESWVTPNKEDYKNPSSLLPEQTTHQYEFGVKNEMFSSALFLLKRPRLYDDGSDFKIEGHYQQYGWETNTKFKKGPTTHQLSLLYLQVKQFGSGLKGKVAPNIPDFTLRYLGELKLGHYTIGSRLQYESFRYASHDNELSIPDWIKWDFFIQRSFKDLNLRAYVDNAFQKNFWKESPIQYGHHYLFQGSSRRVGLLAEYSF